MEVAQPETKPSAISTRDFLIRFSSRDRRRIALRCGDVGRRLSRAPREVMLEVPCPSWIVCSIGYFLYPWAGGRFFPGDRGPPRCPHRASKA